MQYSWKPVLKRLTGEAMCVWRNIEARTCNHCRSGKAISITQIKCAFVALGIQHEMRMRHMVNCGMPGCTVFFYIISYKARFPKKKLYWTNNVLFHFFKTFVWIIFHSRKNLESYDKNNHKNLSNGSRVVQCGRGMDGRTDRLTWRS
jgi:hypothetical protein